MTRGGVNRAKATNGPAAPTGSRRDGERRRGRVIGLLWRCAATVAVFDALLAMCNLPFLADRNRGIDTPASAASRWVLSLPANARILVFCQASDRTAITIRGKVEYTVYPRRFESAWDRLPSDAADRYDAIILLGRSGAAPPNWRTEAHTDRALLELPATAAPLRFAAAPARARRLPAWLGIAGGLLSLAAVCVLGAMILGCSLPAPPFASRPGNIAAAHLVGAAAIAWIETAWIAATGRVSVIPVYLCAAALVPIWRRRRTWPLFGGGAAMDGDSEPPSDGAVSPRGRVANAGLVVGLVAIALPAAFWGAGGDALRIWQFKAQAFWLDGSAAMLHDFAHRSDAMLDYPLLVPIQSWWTYVHCGVAEPRWAQLIGYLFFLDIVAIFAAYAGQHVPIAAQRLGVVVLVCPTIVSQYVVGGWADIPFAAFFVGLAVAAARLTERRERADAALAAWFAAGLIVTKNEGIAAVLCAGSVAAWMSWRGRGALRPAFMVLAAGAAAYLPWFAIKQSLGLKTDLFDRSQYSAPSFAVGSVAWRLWYSVTRGFLAQIACVGPSYPGWGLAGLLVLVGLARRLRIRCGPGGALWGMAGLQIVLYLGIYSVTPLALAWHVSYSADRLALQVFPVLLLGALTTCFGAGVGEPTN